MFYNSGLPCPQKPKCEFVHSIEQKRRIQTLFQLNLYFQRSNKIICPKKDEVGSFFAYLTQQHICQDYYLLDGECKYGANCWYHHINRQDQKNPLVPQVPQLKKKADDQKNITKWHEIKCRHGPNCENKNRGCKYSHEEEKIDQNDENVYFEEDEESHSHSTEKAEEEEENEEIKSEEQVSEESIEENEDEDEEEDEEEHQNVLCQKCPKKKNQVANCLFLPCGHRNLCLACAQDVFTMLDMKKCNLCFKKVKFIKIKN